MFAYSATLFSAESLTSDPTSPVGLTQLALSQGFEFLLALLLIVGLLSGRLVITTPKRDEQMERVLESLERIERKK